MLSRRFFSGCALCAGMQLIASGARAQGAPGFTRTILNQQQLAGTNYDVIQVIVSVDPGALIARHTHPGIESSVFIEGTGVLSVAGMPDRVMKAGDGFEIAPETPHSLRNGSSPTRIAGTYTVERGKPLASPAPDGAS